MCNKRQNLRSKYWKGRWYETKLENNFIINCNSIDLFTYSLNEWSLVLSQITVKSGVTKYDSWYLFFDSDGAKQSNLIGW